MCQHLGWWAHPLSPVEPECLGTDPRTPNTPWDPLKSRYCHYTACNWWYWGLTWPFNPASQAQWPITWPLSIVLYAYWQCVWPWLQFLLWNQYMLVGWSTAQRPGLSVDSNHPNQTSLQTGRRVHLKLSGRSWTESRGKYNTLSTVQFPVFFISALPGL